MASEFRSFVREFICLTLLVIAAAEEESCDKSKCRGPLRYYNDLDCKPVYKNPGDCCPMEFDCDHLKNLSKEKCYANGREYNVEETLKEEDSNPCDLGCTCRMNYKNVAQFTCGVIDCVGPSPNCYLRNSPDKCCSIAEICPEEGEERPTCVVDGVTYQDGDYFKPKSDPDLDCYCMPDYKGENVAPFCKNHTRNSCNPIFYGPGDLHFNCTPVYYSSQDPLKDCSVFSRCQNEQDSVIPAAKAKSAENAIGSEKTCRFGKMSMNVGDELKQATGYDSVCVRCVCEVPPIPTCQQLASHECDITVHDSFF